MSGVAPAVRRKARERALEFLFGLDFTRYPWAEAIGTYWEEHPAKPGVKAYAEEIICGVSEKRDEIDALIARAVERWSPERVGRVERTALRIGVYEMRYRDDVPARVAINEALEVVKRYGTDEAPRFVNGVLDRCRQLIETESGESR